MAEVQTLDLNDIDESKPITFAPLEWKLFKEEIGKQFVDDDLDVLKAIRHARYWAEIERRTERIKTGHWVEHDLIEAENE